MKEAPTEALKKAVAGLRKSATASRMGMIRSPQIMWRCVLNKGLSDPTGVVLIECHADPLFFSPDDVTGCVQSVCRRNQGELIGDSDRAGYPTDCGSYNR